MEKKGRKSKSKTTTHASEKKREKKGKEKKKKKTKNKLPENFFFICFLFVHRLFLDFSSPQERIVKKENRDWQNKVKLEKQK